MSFLAIFSQHGCWGQEHALYAQHRSAPVYRAVHLAVIIAKLMSKSGSQTLKREIRWKRMFTFWFPFKILPLSPSSAMAMLKIHQRKVQVNVDQKMRRRKKVLCLAVWRLSNINLKLESSFHFQLAVFFLPLILPA